MLRLPSRRRFLKASRFQQNSKGVLETVLTSGNASLRMLIPSVAAATHPVVYVRFHGRNWKTWNIRNARTSGERFDWRYSEEELAEWVEPLSALADQAEEAYALFNNNRNDYAPSGAQMLRRLPTRGGGRLGRNRARRPGPATVGRRMKVLAILHGSNVPPGVLGEEAERRGHEIDTWSLAWGTPPPAPVDDYGAVMIFGGSMHADQDDRHPWLLRRTSSSNACSTSTFRCSASVSERS